MIRMRWLILPVLAVILLLLGLGAGICWYLFGENTVESAELVPSDTVAFASIPNAAAIAAGYQSSQLKTIVDSPNVQPLIDAIPTWIGQKNLDLIKAFLPNLSGQSFIALTHVDAEKPERFGLIAAMKPKAGLGDFEAFVAKLKATWPEILKQGATGVGKVNDVDYQWIQGPGAPQKICVAQIHGWIVTTWGEDSLKDWIERYDKKSSTPSLAQNADYQKSLTRVGKDPMTLVYVNYRPVITLIQKELAKTNPTQGDYFARKLGALGGFALGTRFENGEIVDRFSFLIPHQAQVDAGLGATPCPFETLKFTSPTTCFYWATSVDFQQYLKNLEEQFRPLTTGTDPLQQGAQSLGLDLQRNIVGPLGSEMSVQAEWNDDTQYPEVGLFVKLDKPDDFKPTITAIIEAMRKAFAATAVITEIKANDQSFATLHFLQASPVNPTITENGPYLGLFMDENLAVRSFQRDVTLGLPHNADFTRQVGDKRNGAAQVIFIDSPKLVDRAYKTALPFVSMASMFNKNVAAMLKNKTLPDDLAWLSPIGTWSAVSTPDNDGVQGYSVSGIGNQGLFFGVSLGLGAGVMQSMGWMPLFNGKWATPTGTPAPAPSTPSAPPSQNPPPGVAADSTTNAPSATDAPTNAAPEPPAPDTTTNAAPAMEETTQTPPATTPPPTPDATTPTPPVTEPDSSAGTNSDAHATPPAPAQPQ